MIKQCFTNGTVDLKCGTVQMKYNIRCIEPYKSDTKVDNFSSKHMIDDINIRVTGYIILS